MSIYNDILAQVVTDVKALSLTGISDSAIVQSKVVSDSPKLLTGLPSVVIAPFGAKRVPQTAGTNARDDIEYPVAVVTLADGDADPTLNADRQYDWHEKIISKFVHQRLSGVTSVHTCYADPRDVVDAAAFGAGVDAGGVVLRFVSRETRG